MAAKKRNAKVRTGSVEPYLFPETELATNTLPVSDLHTLHYERCKRKDKGRQDILFLHGGPGSRIEPKHRRIFDPRRYRALLFDQRGCGKSTPLGSLEENTTWHLVDDMEKLRKHLEISQWDLVGGSWGSALALAYATKHADRVRRMILRGIFTLRRKELDWFYNGGLAPIFPGEFRRFQKPIPEEERHDMILAYHHRLSGADEEVKMEAAIAWTRWELATNSLLDNNSLDEKLADRAFCLTFATIENHYFKNRGFFESDGFLLDNVDTFRDIPTTIIQGKWDVVCPMMTALELSERWPQATFKVVQDAGHSMFEPGILDAYMTALAE